MLTSVLNYMETDIVYVPAYRPNETLLDTIHEMFAVVVNNAQVYFRQIGIDTSDYDIGNLVSG